MIEISKPKDKCSTITKGTRVRSIAGVGSRGKAGAIGTVIEVFLGLPSPYLVKFDENIGGHDGSTLRPGAGTDGHCWWCFQSMLEVL
jgi:hypothetical protein